MSLSSIMNIATSGMNAAQTQLRVVSDNVSNVNTPGYIRKIADQESLSNQGVGAGVEVTRIRLATDRFLQAASLNAGSEAGRQTVRYELYDRIQTLFGDPSGQNSFFSKIDNIFSAFASIAEDAISGPLRQDAVYKTQDMFDEAARISQQLQGVREDADGRIKSAVETANSLLDQIEKLNIEIAKAAVVDGDSTGALTAQASLINQLSGLMDVRVTTRSMGGVEIRTGGGILLAGQGSARLEYNRVGSVTSESVFDEIWVTEATGQKKALADGLTSGEIKGLLELRDVESVAASERLAELTTRLADELNRAHNASSSVPAPATLTGRNVGQSLDTALAGFTGATNIVVLNDLGVVQSQVEVRFDPGGILIGGVLTDPADFITTLNGQLTGATASFTNGVLSLSATGGNGVAIADDATQPSIKADRGFSHYFGLNDLITTDRPALYDTGLKPDSLHGLAPGGTVTFRFSDPTGGRIVDIPITIPAGDMQQLINTLNDPVNGVGRQGRFDLSSTGELMFTGRGSPAPVMTVVDDHTTQVPSGVSMSEMFGLGGTRASRSDGFTVRSDISRDATKLALAQLNLGVPAGTPALSKNDGSGARLLGTADQRAASFAAAGGSASASMSVSRYASELSGDIGGRAAMAKSKAEGANALFTEATARRTSVEGVNMDEELVLMTTYQQAFNASARLIQAASEMYDTLLGMVR